MWSKLGTPVQSLIVGATVMVVVWLLSPYLPGNQRGALHEAGGYAYGCRGADRAPTGWRL
jgi:hypothetical protein